MKIYDKRVVGEKFPVVTNLFDLFQPLGLKLQIVLQSRFRLLCTT